MRTTQCDLCAQPIHASVPIAQLHVPMAKTSSTPNDQWMPSFDGPIYYKQFDVCVGCARGLLFEKPEECRALDEGVRRVADQYAKRRSRC